VFLKVQESTFGKTEFQSILKLLETVLRSCKHEVSILGGNKSFVICSAQPVRNTGAGLCVSYFLLANI